MRKKWITRSRAKGFSLIELLIAVIILGILAAILIPIVSGRTKQARLVKAQTDMEHIGEAEQRVAIDTGYYVRLWMLNYGVGGGGGGAFNRQFNYEYLVRNIAPGYYSTNNLFIDPTTGDFVVNSAALLTKLQDNETNFNWNGPYVNWHKDSNTYVGDTSPLPDGIPDDPWGNNYLLFTNEGLVLEPQGQIVTNAAFPPNTAGSINQGNLDAAFSRLTIVSLGPDGLPGLGGGTAVGTGDDLVRAAGN